MASTTRDKKSNFHRLVELNTSCATCVLRKYLQAIINKSKLSLKAHLQQALKQNKISLDELFDQQSFALQKKQPRYEDFDVSLLTLIILNTCDVTKLLQSEVKALRRCRNKISHLVTGEISGNTDFNKASQSILTIAKEVGSNFIINVRRQINEIEQSELVRTHWNMELVQMNGEALMMKLVSDNVGQGKHFVLYIALI